MIRVNEKEFAWREGMTVADLLKKLNNAGHYAVIRIDYKYVSRPYFEKTLIPDNADVYLLPMISGG
ncbi:sulfur carrier protein ThiS [Thermodesulfobacteriota bacterium]